MNNRAYLSIGSNIDPEHNLPAAVRLLRRRGRVPAISSAWESPPVGFVDQPNFVNAALLLLTPLSAEELKRGPLAAIEAELGRTRSANQNAPRTIDIDIVLFNDEVLAIGPRHIPSPEIRARAFVAIPLAEIAPDYIHPETGESLHAIAAAFDLALAGIRLREDIRW